MNEIKCPKCHTTFTIDEKDYTAILKQVRDNEFEKEIKEREKLFENNKENSIKLVTNELDSKHKYELSKKDEEILKLKSNIDLNNKTKEDEIKNIKLSIEKEWNDKVNELNLKIKDLENNIKLKDNEKENEIEKIINEKDKSINELKNQISLNEKNFELEKKNAKEKYEIELKQKDTTIEFYKDLKAKQSTKMIGESLEQHCNYEFSRVRSMFNSKTYFEKDNDAKTGSKGDFIFRDYDDLGNEIISIMFEMKNEADTTSTKHKNEDFFKELDKDRNEKKCEYAILVSLLEIDNDIYNEGIVDVSYKYEKMYVIRPQFFIPIITLLRNASLKSLEYRKELDNIRNQNIDITHFEDNIKLFREGFYKSYKNASDRFLDAIKEIDKTIITLQNVKRNLEKSENHLRLANNKVEDLTIKKLTKGNKTMTEMFENSKNDDSD